MYRVPIDIAPLLGGVNLNFCAAAAASNLMTITSPIGPHTAPLDFVGPYRDW